MLQTKMLEQKECRKINKFMFLNQGWTHLSKMPRNTSELAGVRLRKMIVKIAKRVTNKSQRSKLSTMQKFSFQIKTKQRQNNASNNNIETKKTMNDIEFKSLKKIFRNTTNILMKFSTQARLLRSNVVEQEMEAELVVEL